MAPRLLKAVVTLPSVNGLAKDAVKNTFHFYDAGTEAPEDAAANTAINVVAFYNSLVPGDPTAHPVGYFISNLIDRVAASTVQIYDWTGFGATGSPVHTHLFNLAASVATPQLQPAELAACVTFDANATGVAEYGPSGPIPTDRRAQMEGAPEFHTGVTRPASRLRNRVYLGPLIIDAFDANTGLITNGFSELAAAAAQRLAISTADTRLVCASKRGESYSNVVRVWCDNAPDIQRRRGRQATLRNVKIPA